jgi:GNAT superfamily N-acetyltransferase
MQNPIDSTLKEDRSRDDASISARRVTLEEIGALRDAFRSEMNCQIVHDAIHHRRDWTVEFALSEGKRMVGYASIAVSGPWRDKPTFYEFFVVPERRSRAYALFDAFLAAARPAAFEVQSNDVLTTMMALTIGRDLATDRVLFRDECLTTLVLPGATMRQLTPTDEIHDAIRVRQGGGEWALDMDGHQVARGGILFHYNPPYGDVYMEVNEDHRRRGIGGYLVQELKRRCYELGAIPAARCQPSNVASQRTLQRAGLVPCALILTGSFDQSASAR